MVSAVVKNDARFEASDIEFRLPKPSYTIDTIVHLDEKFPHYQFSLIMGEDNLTSFHKWKNSEELLNYCNIYYYPRSTKKQVNESVIASGKVNKVNASVLDISSTYIREKIKEGKSIQYLVPEEACKMIEDKGFYL